jgi:hypothetical protein
VDNVRYGNGTQHPELKLVESDKALLTNSRLSALRKCSRYHFLRYEEPTRKLGAVEESLAIGTGFHNAAEEYLKHFIVSK